jgi:hypothetical protein
MATILLGLYSQLSILVGRNEDAMTWGFGFVMDVQRIVRSI